MAAHNSSSKYGKSGDSRNMTSKLQILFIVLCTNLATVFLLTGPFRSFPGIAHTIISEARENTQNEILASELNQTRQELVALQAELRSSKEETEGLRSQVEALAEFLRATFQEQNSSNTEIGDAGGSMGIEEFGRWVEGKKLPLGYNPNIGSDILFPSVGRACYILREEVQEYMGYRPGGICPDDELAAQKLLLKGCEPLPRRRCFPRIPENFQEPYPFPESLWRIPPDSSILWSAYTCKNYTCLVERKKQKDFDDCKDCFDLKGRESFRWTHNGPPLDLSIDEVLALKKGTVRIGLDIGGGTGTFAVRMRERNVTIVTTSMNFNGPFNNFMASRGVVPLYITISQRLPFFDSTLDIVHSMHVLSNWIPTELLEFIFYDVYRVLRPGGIFWLDHFFCLEDQLQTYVPLIESMGFQKLKWAVARKLDRGPEFKEMYITAVLEKPTKQKL